MFSSYWIDWQNLTEEEKIFVLLFWVIMFIVGIFDYFYNKHKKEKENKNNKKSLINCKGGL